MYEELKARLRSYPPLGDGSLWAQSSKDIAQAADAIEQLERHLEESRMNYLGAMTDCGNLELQLAEALEAMFSEHDCGHSA